MGIPLLLASYLLILLVSTASAADINNNLADQPGFYGSQVKNVMEQRGVGQWVWRMCRRRRRRCGSEASGDATDQGRGLHKRARPGSSSDFHHLHLITVQAMKNINSVYRECVIERLIYTGFADVLFDGVQDFNGGEESLPYSDKFEDPVNELRAQEEAMVLSDNGDG